MSMRALSHLMRVVTLGHADGFRFILNGLRHANELLGKTAFVESEWKVIGEYVYDAEGGRHQAFYSPVRDTIVLGELIRSHDRIQVEQSLKYSPEEARELWNRAGMTELAQWRCRDEYGEWILYLLPSMAMQGFRSRSKSSGYPTFLPRVGRVGGCRAVVRHIRRSLCALVCRPWPTTGVELRGRNLT
jgi:hypothetical protein